MVRLRRALTHPTTMSILNRINPLIVKSARERLRPRNAISWGLVVIIVTGFVYFICYNIAGVQADLRHEQAAKFALLAILVMQGIILMLMGTGSVAIGIAQERMNGVLDYQRMTPMSPTSKILGYMFGLPIREYYLFALTLPFVAYATIQSGIRISNLIHLYMVGFVSVWLYHMTGLVAGIVSPKPWRAGVATQGMVLMMYFVMPALANLGFSFFLYLTPRPVFARLAYEELELADLRGIIYPSDLKIYERLFEFDVNTSVFTVALQGFLILSLFIIVYRKWREESQHPFSKLYALLVYCVTQLLLLGTLWSRLTDGESIRAMKTYVQQMGFGGIDFHRKVNAGNFVLGEFLYVFFAVSLAMSLLMIALIAPTQHSYAKGLRRSRKLNLPSLPRWSDSASALPFGIAFIVLTTITYGVLIHLASRTGELMMTAPSPLALAMPPLIFAAFVLTMLAMCQRFTLRGMFMTMFIAWVVPFLTFILMLAGNASQIATQYTGAPSPFHAFLYAIVNLFKIDDGNLSGTMMQNAGKLTFFAAAVSIALATIALAMLFKHEADIRERESQRPTPETPATISAEPAL